MMQAAAAFVLVGIAGCTFAQTPLKSLGTGPQGGVLLITDAASGAPAVVGLADGAPILLTPGTLTPLSGLIGQALALSGDGRVAVQSVFQGNRWVPRVWENGVASDLPRPQAGAQVWSVSGDGRVLAGTTTVTLAVPGFSATVAARWTRTTSGWSFTTNRRLGLTQLVSASGVVLSAGPGPDEFNATSEFAALWHPDGTVEILPNIPNAGGGFVGPLASTGDANIVAGVTEVTFVPPDGGELVTVLMPVVWERTATGWTAAALPAQAGAEFPPLALPLAVTDGGAIIASNNWVWERDGSRYSEPVPLAAYLTSRRCDVEAWSDIQLVSISSDGRTWYGTGINTLAPGGPREESWVVSPPSRTCDDIDVNNDGAFPSEQDVLIFFELLSGAACPAPLPLTCDSIDFNGNQVFPEDQDVIDFFTVLAGGSCA